LWGGRGRTSVVDYRNKVWMLILEPFATFLGGVGELAILR
jgi:hypothetical protein